MALTGRQERFVAEYLVDLNATQAAIRAGFSPRSAQVHSSRLLSKAMIAEEIARKQREHLANVGATAEDVMRVNGYIINLDLAECYGDDGQLLAVKDMPKHVRLALKKVKTRIENLGSGDGKQDITVEVTAEDKGKALALDYQRHQLLIEKTEVTGTLEITWKGETP